MTKHIKPLIVKNIKGSVNAAACKECQTSCQSACKTSCTVGNQVCEART
jgi:predicted ribosomally synthesized six-cysteine peptide SCIFF